MNNNNSDALKELELKIKGMSKTELVAYKKTVAGVSRVLDCIGIFLCLMVLAYSSVFLTVVVSFIVYVLLVVYQGVSSAGDLVSDRLKKFEAAGK